VVIHATRHCRFVSKSELRDWPVLGTLATGGGTLYIQRAQRKDAMRMVKDMAQSLRNGDVLGVFPEGTTGDGIGMLPFHANLIQAAIEGESPVQPVALQFVDAKTNTLSMAARYIDDDTLLGSVWSTLNARGLKAVVIFGAAQIADGRDRRQWAIDLHREVLSLKGKCLTTN
jgi:1-acyl-sn-glycerol-3-phosphate acyltransferase